MMRCTVPADPCGNSVICAALEHPNSLLAYAMSNHAIGHARKRLCDAFRFAELDALCEFLLLKLESITKQVVQTLYQAGISCAVNSG